MGSTTIDKTPTAGETDKNSPVRSSGLSPDDEREIELFLQNSGKYSEKVYGGKTFCDEEITELRKEIKETNEAVKKIRTEWKLS
jgi:hypothetical protein